MPPGSRAAKKRYTRRHGALTSTVWPNSGLAHVASPRCRGPRGQRSGQQRDRALPPRSNAPGDRGRGIQLMHQLARSVVISAGNVGTTVLLQPPLPINGRVAPGL